MRVAFRVDAGPLIGGGHAMRCLTLADALATEGAETVFVTSGISEPIAERIAASGHPLVQIPPSAGAQRSGPGWHEPVLEAPDQEADARATGEAVGSADWMVVDHYLLDACWHSAARGFAGRIAVIDDLANRPCDCELLVDQNAGRAAGDYEPWVPAEARVLAGPHFALLRA